MADTTENERAPRRKRGPATAADKAATPRRGKTTKPRGSATSSKGLKICAPQKASGEKTRKSTRPREWQHHPFAVHASRSFHRPEIEAFLIDHNIEAKAGWCSELEQALARCEGWWLRLSTAPTPTEWKNAFRKVQQVFQAVLDLPEWALMASSDGGGTSLGDMQRVAEDCIQEAQHLQAAVSRHCRGRGKKWGGRDADVQGVQLQGVLLQKALEPLWRHWMPDKGGCLKRHPDDDSPGVLFLKDAAHRLLSWTRCDAPSLGEGRHTFLMPTREPVPHPSDIEQARVDLGVNAQSEDGPFCYVPNEDIRFDLRMAAHLHGTRLEEVIREERKRLQREHGANSDVHARFTPGDKPKAGA